MPAAAAGNFNYLERYGLSKRFPLTGAVLGMAIASMLMATDGCLILPYEIFRNRTAAASPMAVMG